MKICYFSVSIYSVIGGFDVDNNIDNSIYFLKNYGKITLTLNKIMDEKKITRNKLSMITGSTYNVIDRYYNNDISRLDLDVLARICFVLNCDISDIIKYEKNNNPYYQSN